MSRPGTTCAAFLVIAILCSTAAFASASQGESSQLSLRLAQIMQEQVEDGFYGVVLVARSGEIVLHEGYGLADRKSRAPMRKDTAIDAGSFSKQVTAAAAVLLESQGKLSLDDPLRKYFDKVPADKQDITIKQLLSHTAGLYPWILPEDFVPIPREAWLEKVFSAPLKHPPGGEYLYSNDGFTLVAMIIEKVSGKPYRDYIKETFFRPLRMTHSGWYDDAIFKDPSVSVATGYYNGKDDGAPNEWPGPYWALLGNGGILWTAGDMLKWHKAVHGNLLPKAAKEKLFAPVAEVKERPGYDGEQPRSQYALGWNIGRTKCGDVRIGHTGAGISHNVDYRYYAQRDLLVYVASSKLDKNYQDEEIFYARRAANAIAREVLKDCQ